MRISIYELRQALSKSQFMAKNTNFTNYSAFYLFRVVEMNEHFRFRRIDTIAFYKGCMLLHSQKKT